MSTLVNVVQSSRDLEMNRIHTGSGVGSHDVRVIRRRKKSEAECMNNCKACICLSFTFSAGVYIIAVIIVMLTEDNMWYEIDGDGSHS